MKTQNRIPCLIAWLLLCGSVAQATVETGSSAGGVSLSTVNAWTGQQYFATQALTFSSGGTAWNLNTQCTATLAATGNFTLSNPTNIQTGSACDIAISQPASGGPAVITYGTAYKFPGGNKFILSTAASALDILTCKSYDGSTLDCVGQPAFQ